MTVSRRSVLGSALVLAAASEAHGATAQERGADDFGYIRAESYGATGDGLHDDTDALSAAFREAASSSRAVYLLAGRTYAARDLRVPEGAVVVLESGATLKPLGASTLTLDGRLMSVGLVRIFEPGWTFRKTDIVNGYPDVPIEWFGGKASYLSKPDCKPAFDYAIAFCKGVRARHILLDVGIYYVESSIIIDDVIGIKGNGYNSTSLIGRNAVGRRNYIIELKGSRDSNFTEIEYSEFVIRSETVGFLNGLKAIWFAQVIANRLHFLDCYIGLDLIDTSYSWRLLNCTFVNNDYAHIRLGVDANNTLVSGCHFINGNHGIVINDSLNSITICNETNFEALSGSPVGWIGNKNTIYKISIVDCRFEKCKGHVGNISGNVKLLNFTFTRNFLENSNKTTKIFLNISNCDGAVISNSLFMYASESLINLSKSSQQVTINDNTLVDVPKINAATASGGVSGQDGYTRCGAYNCSGVKGSTDAS